VRKLEEFKEDFRVFEVTEDTYVLDINEGEKKIEKGYRFIGLYWGENKQYVWISNTDYDLKAKRVKELYKVDFKKESGLDRWLSC